MIAQQFYKKEMIFMPAYKDEKTGKWFAKFYYTNWQGIKKQKWKRGFATKKEAFGSITYIASVIPFARRSVPELFLY